MLKKSEAEQLIAIEFARWAAKQRITEPTGRDGLRFFSYLQDKEPHLLSFRASGDKWQDVRAFLLRRRLVSD